MLGPAMAMEPVEPQSVKKLSFKSLKRALDFFSPLHGHFHPPDPESKKIRLSHKINVEYGGLKPALAQHQPTKQDQRRSSTPSDALALPAPEDAQKGGVQLQNALVVGPATQPRLNDVGPSKSTAVISTSGPSERFSTSALMERIPSRWPRPVWHAPWKNYRVISGHLGWVRSIAFDPSNNWFCTGSADRTIKIWYVATGRLKLTLTGHIEQIRGLAISDRHTYMFSAGDDKMVKCWDLEQNKDGTRHPRLSSIHMSNPIGIGTRVKVSSGRKKHCCLHKWDELNDDILVEIFSRVPNDDLLMNVSWVCQSWHSASLNALFWTRQNVLDLTPVAVAAISKGVGIRRYHDKLSSSNNTIIHDGNLNLNLNLTKLLKHVMEGEGTTIFASHDQMRLAWKQAIQTVLFPCDLQVRDEHLLYIAKRTPCVKHLSLLNPLGITSDCIAKATTVYWKNIKELHIGRLTTNICTKSLREMRNWKRLETLHIYDNKFHFYGAFLVMILRFPALKKVTFHGGFLFTLGIWRLFKNCTDQLQEVCFNECEMIWKLMWFEPPRGGYSNHIYDNIRSFSLKWTKDCHGFPLWHVKLAGQQNNAHHVDFQTEFNTWMDVYGQRYRRHYKNI